MSDLRTQIRDALGDEEGNERLSVDEAAAMRRFVVGAVRLGGDTHAARPWFRPLAVAATLVAMIAVGIAIGRDIDDRSGTAAANSGSKQERPASGQPDGARQLHFSTPGGTRIIWIFNSDLELKTTP